MLGLSRMMSDSSHLGKTYSMLETMQSDLPLGADCVLPKDMFKSQPLVPLNVIIFGNRVFAEAV